MIGRFAALVQLLLLGIEVSTPVALAEEILIFYKQSDEQESARPDVLEALAERIDLLRQIF